MSYLQSKQRFLDDDSQSYYDEDDISQSEDDDVLRVIADEVVKSKRDDLDQYKNCENESDDSCGEAFIDVKADLKRLFYKKFIKYVRVYKMWKHDDAVKQIIRHSNTKSKAFDNEEALKASLDKHKQIVYSRLKQAVNNYLNSVENDDNNDNQESDDNNDDQESDDST